MPKIGYPTRDLYSQHGTKLRPDLVKLGKNVTIYSGTIIYIHSTIGDGTFIGHNTVIRENTNIGKRARIGSMAIIEPGAEIGDDCAIGTFCFISEYSKTGNNVFVAPHTSYASDKYPVAPSIEAEVEKGGPPIVGDNVIIGVRCVIMPTVRIGNDVVVGSGSVVTKNLESGFVYAGNPARRMNLTIKEYHKKRKEFYK